MTGLQIGGLVIHFPRNISNSDVMDETTVKRNRSTAKRAFTWIHQTLEEQIERVEVQSEYDKYVDITFKGEEEDAETSRWIKKTGTIL